MSMSTQPRRACSLCRVGAVDCYHIYLSRYICRTAVEMQQESIDLNTEKNMENQLWGFSWVSNT